MDTENEPTPLAPELPPAGGAPDSIQPEPLGQFSPEPYRGLKWMFIGPSGLRAGWSVLIFLVLFVILTGGFGFLFLKLHLIVNGNVFTPHQQFFSELFQVLALLLTVTIMAIIERRKILDYNLRGARRLKHFFSGVVVGFAALSALVGSLAWGHWLHFGPVALSGSQILKYALMWGVVFLLVGCFEEGMMRCYLQYTFTRGVNFWWAFGVIVCVCGLLFFTQKGNGVWGVYGIALLGLVPCLLLQLKSAPATGFWNAAWLTSTLFGAAHTGNNGENWIGIFAAAFIGFAFCVSIWLTGSAWWAIGCHAAWDWAESYFYGTADSGFWAQGHLLTSRAAGDPLWSGGTDGPEGSLLVIPVVLLLIAWLVVVYRRPAAAKLSPPAATEQLAS